VSERYGLPFMPSPYLLDREGMIVGQTVGPKAWDSAEAKALPLSLIHQPQGSRVRVRLVNRASRGERQMQTIDLPIRGMACASCVATIERGLRRVPGAQTASVNLAAGQATISYDPAIAQVNHLIQAIEDAGYEVAAARTTEGTSGTANQPSTMQALKQILKMAACCAGPILGLALLAPLAGTLGIGVSSVVSVLFVLACPLSMVLMMYLMMRSQKAERQGQRRAEAQPLPPRPSPDTAAAMAEGNGRPQGREALPRPEAPLPLPVIERETPQRNLSRP
jgi:copper chaperone CopZ